MEIKQLKSILDNHRKWLIDNCDGERADLGHVDLRGAYLRGADLRGANLMDANLGGADLRGANLGGADLRYADLRSADFSGADLRSADLRGAGISRAKLIDANLLLIGQDSRGHLFYGYANEDGVMEVMAGCRRFLGLEAARKHWLSRHIDNNVLHEEILSLLDHAERMALVRGWKT